MKFRSSLIALVVLLFSIFMPSMLSVQAGGSHYFPETGHTVDGTFLNYLDNRGGIDLFGYPVTDVVEENGRKVQYFERNRFEYHPENEPRYQVQLGLLGNWVTEGRTEQPFNKINCDSFITSLPNDEWCIRETGHTLKGDFLYYWRSHGGIDIFGGPISEPFDEVSPTDGKHYWVQYFERNRFELHTERPRTDKYYVQLGLLGSEYLAHKGSTPSNPTQPPAGQQNCGPAKEMTFQTPTDYELTGPAISHPWWNNGKPSFGQTQVRTMIEAGWKVKLLGAMGKAWQWEQGCTVDLQKEFSNASYPVKTVDELEKDGLLQVLARGNAQPVPTPPPGPNPPAENTCKAGDPFTMTEKTNHTVIGPAILLGWWPQLNNGAQGRTLINVGEKLYIKEARGQIYQYPESCSADQMVKEFNEGGAKNLPVYTIDFLVSKNLAERR